MWPLTVHGIPPTFLSTKPIQYPTSSNIAPFVVLLITADLEERKHSFSQRCALPETCFNLLYVIASLFFELCGSLFPFPPTGSEYHYLHETGRPQTSVGTIHRAQWVYRRNPVIHQSGMPYIHQHFIHCIA